jgi:hypothetical protein
LAALYSLAFASSEIGCASFAGVCFQRNWLRFIRWLSPLAKFAALYSLAFASSEICCISFAGFRL